MVATSSSEMTATTYKCTWRYNPEDHEYKHAPY
jgi:hypothetical protein